MNNKRMETRLIWGVAEAGRMQRFATNSVPTVPPPVFLRAAARGGFLKTPPWEENFVGVGVFFC